MHAQATGSLDCRHLLEGWRCQHRHVDAIHSLKPNAPADASDKSRGPSGRVSSSQAVAAKGNPYCISHALCEVLTLASRCEAPPFLHTADMSCHQHRPIKDQERSPRSQTDGCDPEQTLISHSAWLWTAVDYDYTMLRLFALEQRYARGFPEAPLPYLPVPYPVPEIRSSSHTSFLLFGASVRATTPHDQAG